MADRLDDAGSAVVLNLLLQAHPELRAEADRLSQALVEDDSADAELVGELRAVINRHIAYSRSYRACLRGACVQPPSARRVEGVARRVAVAMGGHERLGAGSPLRRLPAHLRRAVALAAAEAPRTCVYCDGREQEDLEIGADMEDVGDLERLYALASCGSWEAFVYAWGSLDTCVRDRVPVALVQRAQSVFDD